MTTIEEVFRDQRALQDEYTEPEDPEGPKGAMAVLKRMGLSEAEMRNIAYFAQEYVDSQTALTDFMEKTSDVEVEYEVPEGKMTTTLEAALMALLIRGIVLGVGYAQNRD